MEVAGDVAVPAPHPARRAARVGLLLAGLALAGLVCQLAGVDLDGWLAGLADRVSEVSPGWVVLGFALQTLQTFVTALAWVAILRFAYGRDAVGVMPVFAAYAVSVALNTVLPANIGTFVMLMMFLALVPGATLPGVFAGFLVQKLFFAAVAVALYLYLFVSIEGSFSVKLGLLARHPLAAAAVVAGAALLVVAAARLVWTRGRRLWHQARQGGGILSEPRTYLVRVVLPELAGYAAKLGVIAVFLAAYSIPVTLHGVLFVGASNSIANLASVTPGGVGVNQTLNVAALHGEAHANQAAAYSIGHQVLTTAWNIALAVGLVAAVFGWSGGRRLVASSYHEARERVSELRSSEAP